MFADADWVPDAVVFDCDGLLVDTEWCWSAAASELGARRGVTFDDAERARLLGVSVPAACAALAARFDDGCTVAEVESELLARVAVIVARDARAMAGAGALVTSVRSRRPVAVASNSPRALLDQTLARGGFAGAFAVSLAADEVARPKPEPDLYLAACERLGVAPERALALEDSPTGVRAALAAGLRTVAVPTFAGARLGADLTVAGLDDPVLVGWVEGWPEA